MTPRTKSGFVARFGNVYEHSAWVAERAFDHLEGVDGIQAIGKVMAECVDRAPFDLQLKLIRSHPDLADKAGVAGDLTAESAVEQSSAGLDRCSPDEYARLAALTRSYRKRFGFPFVMAVRGSSPTNILNALRSRLGNDPAVEFETALAEIHKIALLRLQSIGVVE